MRNTVFVACLGLVTLVSISGCGETETKGRPKLFPASGTVTRGGKGVENASVIFVNDSMPRTPSGHTDAQGNFQLGTFGNNDGAPTGDYIVVVTKVVASAAPATMNDPAALAKMAGSGQMKAPAADASVPAKYGDPKQTTLKATVRGDGQDKFTFDLVD